MRNIDFHKKQTKRFALQVVNVTDEYNATLNRLKTVRSEAETNCL